jgi:nucleoside-diphosphate-sugar epimerase
VILQPTIVYGPFGVVWTRQCLDLIRQYDVPLPNGGSNPCNAVYVDDVVHAMQRAATEPAAVGETILVSAAESVPWRQFYGAFGHMLDVDGVCPLDDDDIDRLARGERRAARRRAARRVVDSLSQLSHDPDVADYLRGVPLPRRARSRLLRLGKRLRHRLPGGPRSGTRSPHQAGRPVFVPGDSLMRVYRSTAVADIAKARRLLDYEPRYDLHRGMELTAEYARWARLIP